MHQQPREISRPERAVADRRDERIPQLIRQRPEANDVARRALRQRVPHHAQKARPHPRVILRCQIIRIALRRAQRHEEDVRRWPAPRQDEDGLVARVRREVHGRRAGGVQQARARRHREDQDGAEAGDLLAQPRERGQQRRRGLALLVHPVEDEDEALRAVEQPLQLHEERAEVLASRVRRAVEGCVRVGVVDGVEAGGEGAFEQVSAGYAFAGVDNGMGEFAGLEDAPDYRGLAGSIETVYDKG